MNQEEFEARFLKPALQKPQKRSKWLSYGAHFLKEFSFLKTVYSFIPILEWLPKYRWKEDLHGDIIGGLTVGIMHVPQGMAYASLASVPPVYGLYSSFFTSSIYAFFGTSRHVSIGVFAVASMMFGAVRLRLIPEAWEPSYVTNNTDKINISTDTVTFDPSVSPMVLASALTFGVGLAQLMMAMLHLSFLTTYLSDPLVSGFTTGSACHVFTAQLNKALGVKLPRYSGMGMLFFMLRDLIVGIPEANYFTVAMSVCGIVFLKLGKDYVNPFVKKRCPVPVPLELILVMISTLLSTLLKFKLKYGVAVVDYVPQGVPKPSLPRIDLLPMLMTDAFGIAVVSYMFVISMAKLFAKKRKYKIDPGQELYAVGFMSFFSSFFPVYPAGASLSRSSVCEQSGANTQLYTLFSSALLLTVIIWLGPLLEPLPMCILACIVMVSLESLFMQVKELPLLWKISKFDFMVWVVSCIATVSSTVMTGLIVSVLFNILSVTLREQWPKIRNLGHFSVEDVYKPDSHYVCSLKQMHNVRIIRFEAPLHFANVEHFKEKVASTISTFLENDTTIRNVQAKTLEEASDQYSLKEQKTDSTLSDSPIPEKLNCENAMENRIIIDCSAMPFIDNMGLEALKEVYADAQNVGIRIYLADLSESVLDVFRKIDTSSAIPNRTLFPNVHQAVQYCTSV